MPSCAAIHAREVLAQSGIRIFKPRNVRTMNLRPLLHDLVRQHGLDRKAAVQLFALAGFEQEPAALRTRLWPVVALLGAALGGLGIVLWIAANWESMGRMQRFALLQGFVLVMCLGAAWRAAARRWLRSGRKSWTRMRIGTQARHPSQYGR